MNTTILAPRQSSLQRGISTGMDNPGKKRVTLPPAPGKSGTSARFELLPQGKSRFGSLGASIAVPNFITGTHGNHSSGISREDDSEDDFYTDCHVDPGYGSSAASAARTEGSRGEAEACRRVPEPVKELAPVEPSSPTKDSCAEGCGSEAGSETCPGVGGAEG